ncbi:MAG: hypothetical protein EA387_09500 [Nitriliruptor sp.]|nr:MAG: hypothetical protein EA387_09500 [Nitriliruptor sp.]
MERGPIEVIVLAFPGIGRPDGVDAAVDAMREVGDIRLISAMTITRPLQGAAEVEQVAAFDDVGDVTADIVAYAAVGMPNADAVDAAVNSVTPGSTAVLFVVEHVWAVGFAAEVRAAGGKLVDSVRLTEELLDAAERVLGEDSPSRPN